MKKLITLILGIAFIYSCSTSTDGNGNTTAVPVPPSNLRGTVASNTQINLSWTDNSTNETGFKIERKTGTGVYAVVGTTATDINTYSDNGLTSNTTYTYRVYSYNAGGNSPTYSNEINLLTDSGTSVDYDGNTYQLVAIGTQIWTKSNLNVSKYRDGTPIPQVTDLTAWASLTTGAWCYNNNTTANGTTYGKLYNWYAVAGIHDNDPNTPNKTLAPTGSHMPSDAEWTTLTNYLGGESIAGGKMKSTGTTLWVSPNTGATNESGFTGLPGGERTNNGSFGPIGYSCILWSSSESSTSSSWVRILDSSTMVSRINYLKAGGFSVRCIKD